MVIQCFLGIDLLDLMSQCEVQQAYSCSSKSHSSPQAQTLSATLCLLNSNLLTWRQEESVNSKTTQKIVT